MKLAVKLTTYLLKHSKLSLDDRNTLIIHILDKLEALPFRDIIRIDENGSLLINERPITIEEAKILRESARSALNSQALKIIRDQVAFKSVTIGVHKAERADQLLFGKAALWWGQQEQEILKILAGEQEPDL